MDGWQLILFSAAISAIVAIPSGYFGSVLFYKYQKGQEEKEIMPKVAISQFIRDGSIYGQIHNVGSEDINNLEVELRWQQEGKEQSRTEYRFYKPSDQLITASPEKIKYLKKDQETIFTTIPQLPGEIVQVIVRGSGVKSGNRFEKVDEVKVPLQVGMYM